MKPTSEKIIKILQGCLTSEFTAVQQYLLHSHLLEDWGFAKIAAHEKAEAKEEGDHVDVLTQRILFLGGMPDYKTVGELHIGSNVEEVLKNDLLLEQKAIKELREGIAYCREDKDYTTESILINILKDEESHIDHIETELSTLNLIGIKNYLQSQYVPADS